MPSKDIVTYYVTPRLPERLKMLETLATNLRWCWDLDMRDCFLRLNRDLWDEVGHNPVLFLGKIDQAILEEASTDEAYLAHFDRVVDRFTRYMEEARSLPEWQEGGPKQIAYFCMEYGLNECMPIYSGGLGVLAGDHLKSASDLNLPVAAVGLLYQQGYFNQYLNLDGWQQERYPINDFSNLPVKPEYTSEGKPVVVTVEFPGRNVYAKVWRVQVGRVPLFLLDTNLPINKVEDQKITDQLYGGDLERRLQQEIILAIGGLRALDQMGIQPTICHMNEGHSSLIVLERARLLMHKTGRSFAEVMEAIRAGNVFTTHTPVPAGFDVFPIDMAIHYLGDYAKHLGITQDQLLNLGKPSPYKPSDPFNMAVLALRGSCHYNGVSQIHGQVTRKMLHQAWPGFLEEEVPVTHITNAVHLRTWIAREMVHLFDRYLGSGWRREPQNPESWEAVDRIPDEELWRVHERQKGWLIAFARKRLKKQFRQRGMTSVDIDSVDGVLNHDILTIGFARRFATYKRGALLLRDPDRFIKILNDHKRPVQIIFAGKAHPKDNGGKELIRQIVHFAQRREIWNRITFVEDYDMNVARYLVQGVDVWLNTPRRPMEASGTSGMKVVPNGGLNLSVLDGWWGEAYDPEVGWAIGAGEVYDDPEYQDEVEANHLYYILEKEVAPLYYDRGADDVPREWLKMVKRSIRKLMPTYNAQRMLLEYSNRFYLPAAQRYRMLVDNNLSSAEELSRWKKNLFNAWKQIRVDDVRTVDSNVLSIGMKLSVEAFVHLGELKPGDVSVELYSGPLNADRNITEGRAIIMANIEEVSKGDYRYRGEIECQSSGLHGYTVRVMPANDRQAVRYEIPLIIWKGDR